MVSVVFDKSLSDLLSAPNIVGRTGKVFTTASLSTTNNLAVLAALLNEHQPKRTLEIGFALGASALLFAAHHRNGHGIHTAIDPNERTVWDSAGLDAIERSGLSEYLDFRDTPSAIALSDMLKSGDAIDMAYIDGSHLFEDVFVDAYFVVRLLSRNGIVAFDDCSDPHVKKVVRFIRRTLPNALQELDLSKYRPGLRYRVATALRRVQLVAFRKTSHPQRSWDARFVSF